MFEDIAQSGFQIFFIESVFGNKKKMNKIQSRTKLSFNLALY